MGWQDRDYNQSGYGRGGHPILAALNGSLPLGTWFGIRVRVHAWLIIFILFTLMLDQSKGYDLVSRLESMGMLFVIILLHEFGHCFACRWVGGTAEDILMWPLGGLAMAQPPHRPWPTLVTVAGGPLVNVAICALAAAALWIGAGQPVSLNPFNPYPIDTISRAVIGSAAWKGVWWTFVVSYYLLLFNILPIFPLDGGQLFQSMLWFRMGYYRSTLLACNTGMIGSAVLGLYGLFHLTFLIIFIAINCFMLCYQRRMMLRESGPGEWGDESGVDFSASLRPERKTRRLSKRTIKRAQKLAAAEQAEQARIDEILAKVSAHGMQSLTWWERRTLKKATEHQRQRDLELTKRQDW
jgi:Zn-dependent protease